MQLAYIARRFAVFLLIVWLAATLNFFLPKLSGQDPVRAKLLQSAQLGGYVHAGLEDMVKDRPALGTFPNRAPVQGGLPIFYQGECVGGVGVSGVKSSEDEQVAAAGIAAL